MLYEWYEKDFIIQCPQSNFIGENVTKKLIPLIKNYKFQKVLIVTDKSLIKFKIVDILSEELKTNAIEFNIFDGVTPNPTIATVNEILNAYYNNKNDAIISVGGGSSHDAAKAAVMLITNSKVRNLRKFQGLNVTRHVAIMPIICVNTTSGTGSECTNVAVITNETAHYKMTLVDKYLQPSITVNDSSMLKTLPPYITATTGMDALVHAIESHLSLFNNPYAQSQARMAINLIFK
jgi:alcohol dehydrogenase